jgi:hypothetical protein
MSANRVFRNPSAFKKLRFLQRSGTCSVRPAACRCVGAVLDVSHANCIGFTDLERLAVDRLMAERRRHSDVERRGGSRLSYVITAACAAAKLQQVWAATRIERVANRNPTESIRSGLVRRPRPRDLAPGRLSANDSTGRTGGLFDRP